VLGAALMTNSPHLIMVSKPLSIYTGIPIILLVGLGWGAINGLAVSRIGLPPLIVTFATWQITSGVGFQISGGDTIFHLPDNLGFVRYGSVAGVPVSIVIWVVAAVVAYFVLNYTRYGRFVYAVGGNPVSAQLSGISVPTILFSVYAISAFLASLTGVMFMSKAMSASVQSLVFLELDCIAAVIIGGVSLYGGRGSLIGVVIGVLIIGVLNNTVSLFAASGGTQFIVKGVIIFAAVAIDILRRR